MSMINTMEKKYNHSRGVLLSRDTSPSGTICEVWRDSLNGCFNIRHFSDMTKIKRQQRIIQDINSASYNPKSNSLFSSKQRGGDRVIATIPEMALIERPEIRHDPKELMKVLDANPQWKRVPAMWTSTTPNKKMFTGFGEKPEIIKATS